jgi:hypothetical protein
MQPKRNMSRSSSHATRRPASFELPPDRAFVLQLDIRAHPPHRMLGRVEHVSSGRVAHVTSLRGLVAFLGEVLCTAVTGDSGDGIPSSDTGPRRPQLAPNTRGLLEEGAAASAGQPTVKGRKGGPKS